MAKIYVTIYALTRGIEEVEVEIKHSPSLSANNGEFAATKDNVFYYPKRDYYLTKEEAVKKAEEMRDNKIKSLKKQLEKLSKMTFK